MAVKTRRLLFVLLGTIALLVGVVLLNKGKTETVLYIEENESNELCIYLFEHDITEAVEEIPSVAFYLCKLY